MLFGRRAKKATGKRGQARPRSRFVKLWFEQLEDRLAPANVSWNVDVSGPWDVGSDWSTGQVPTSADDVTINRAISGLTITVRSGNQAVHSLQSNEALAVSGGSLTLLAPSSLSAVTVSNGAAMTVAATTWSDVTVDHAALTTDARQDMTSLSIVNSGFLTHAANTATTTHLVDLHVTGTVTVDASSSIDVSSEGYLPGRTTGHTT